MDELNKNEEKEFENELINKLYEFEMDVNHYELQDNIDGEKNEQYNTFVANTILALCDQPLEIIEHLESLEDLDEEQEKVRCELIEIIEDKYLILPFC